MTINPGQTFDGHEPLSLFTYDVQGLKDVLSECKHLKELSGMHHLRHVTVVALIPRSGRFQDERRHVSRADVLLACSLRVW